MNLLSDEIPLHMIMRVRAQLFDVLQATASGLADLAAAGVRARVSGTLISGGFKADDRVVYHLAAVIPDELATPIRQRYAGSCFVVEAALDESATFGLEAIADAVQAVVSDELSDEVLHVRADAETMAHLMAVAKERNMTVDEVVAEIAIERGLSLAAVGATEKVN